MLENGDNLNFIGALCLHQNRRDSAIGLTHTTKAQKGLIWYYNVKKQEIYTNLIANAYKLGMVKGINSRLKQIKKSITPNTPLDKAQKLYQEYLSLQEQLSKIQNG